MELEIISPNKKIYSGKVKLVEVPGEKGPFEILRNHAPIISTLVNGKIKIVNHEGEKSYFEIKTGVVELVNNKITLLVTLA